MVLSEADREHLEFLTRQHRTGKALAMRAKIVLMAANGKLLNGEIAETVETIGQTVGKWGKRFIILGSMD